MSLISALLLIAVGAVACFFGKRLYRVMLALIGFVIGFYATAELLGTQPDLAAIVGAVLAGLVVGAAFTLLYKFAYILFGLGLGLVLAEFIATALGLQDTPALILALVLAVVGAVVGWRLADFILRLSTALGGAVQVVAGVGALAAVLGLNLPLLDVTRHSAMTATSTAGIISVLAAGVLGAFGYAYQSQQDARRSAK